jgi:stringent starvation protein B
MEMTSTRPYLIRAIYEWILENRCTPYLLADATVKGMRVPPQAVKEGQVVLNLAPMAIDRLDLGLDEVRFNARFGGVSQTVYVPVQAVLAIYAKENGQGMMFPAEEAPETESATEPSAEVAVAPALNAISSEPADPSAQPDPERPERPRPTLRIVK